MYTILQEKNSTYFDSSEIQYAIDNAFINPQEMDSSGRPPLYDSKDGSYIDKGVLSGGKEKDTLKGRNKTPSFITHLFDHNKRLNKDLHLNV